MTLPRPGVSARWNRVPGGGAPRPFPAPPQHDGERLPPRPPGSRVRAAVEHGAAWLCALALLAALGACAKTGDVERIEQENRVRDARLKALEDGMVDAVRKQTAALAERLDALQRSVEARSGALADRLEQLAAEQTRLSEENETTRAQGQRLARRFDDYAKEQRAAVLEQVNELDKLRGRVTDLDKLLKSPIADLPAATEADKAWREAHFLMLSGQMDLAADRFAQFMQAYPADRRRPEALLRQGVAYFIIRKYDYSLAPLYELVDKHGSTRAATEGRWYIARALEETGDVKLARAFYAQLITGKTLYAADASRRVQLIQKLYPDSAAAPRDGSKNGGERSEPAKSASAAAPPPAPPPAPGAAADTAGSEPERPQAAGGEKG